MLHQREPGLVTSCMFKGGDEYVVRMTVANKTVEITVTNKHTAESWHSSYDTAYIENLTQRTGNFKQFDVFVAMLKSGLLKSRECISLDLLTFEDLKFLRSQRIDTNSNPEVPSKNNNKRYLILTYSVEFDRIHYPLPLEYNGAPDPVLLQATIRRLEAKIRTLESDVSDKDLERRVEELTLMNKRLMQENQKLSNGKGIKRLMSDLKSLENTVAKERIAFRSEIQALQNENITLAAKLRQLLESNDRCNFSSRPCTPMKKKNSQKSSVPVPINGRRSNSGKRCRSRSPSVTGQRKSSLTRVGSVEILQIKDSARSIRSQSRNGTKDSDYGNLELRINLLRKMLEEGVRMN